MGAVLRPVGSLPRAFASASAWFLVTRPLFLLGSIVLAVAGTSLAWWEGYFNPGHAVLAFFGLLFWHTSVNVLNDYFDYKSGITPRGPSSAAAAACCPPGRFEPDQSSCSDWPCSWLPYPYGDTS